MAGSGVRNLYYGTILEPLRHSYHRQLEEIERQILSRREALGRNPTAYELRNLAQWAARQRAATARLWRIPTPADVVALEARDWATYGPGGRTFDNLMRRKMAKPGVTEQDALRDILRTARTSNADIDARVGSFAKHLRRGGGVLAVAGLGLTAHEIIEAPEEERGEVAARAGVSMAGGLIGAEVGVALLGVGAALLAATPPGWLIIGVGLAAGVAGSLLAEGLFFPDEAEPVARALGRGYAVDPRRPTALPDWAVSGEPGIGPTRMPVVRSVSLAMLRGETPEQFHRRALQQAAISAGLTPQGAQAFALRHSSGTLQWVSGDPTPGTGNQISAHDINLSAGQRVTYTLAGPERDELVAVGQ